MPPFMNETICSIGNLFPNTRPNGGANRAADHGTHRTTNAGPNSRTSLSPGPASSRDH